MKLRLDCMLTNLIPADLRRTSRRPCNLQLADQLRNKLQRAAIHQRDELRERILILRRSGAGVHAAGRADVHVGEGVEAQVRGDISTVYCGGGGGLGLRARGGGFLVVSMQKRRMEVSIFGD